MVQLIVVRRKNFRVELRRKVFNRSLSPLYRHHKNKRPPPLTTQMLNGSISIGLAHVITSIINIY